MPTWTELSHFLAHGSPTRRLREDAALERLHRVTSRCAVPEPLAVLAFDHRTQLEEVAARQGAAPQRIAQFKALVARAATQGYAVEHALHPHDAGFPAPGVIVDERHGDAVLHQLTGTGLWIGRPVELPGSRPLAFEAGPNVGLSLLAWPREQVLKCLVSHHPDDAPALAQQQLASVKALYQACRSTGHELLLELIPPRDLPADELTVVRGVAQFYAAGIRPEWWKLPPLTPLAWAALDSCIAAEDPYCRGVLLLGLEASEEQLWNAFRDAAGQPLCKGFAVGRTLFAAAAQGWFEGSLDDAGVVADVAGRYQRLIRMWLQARQLQPPTLAAASAASTERPA